MTAEGGDFSVTREAGRVLWRGAESANGTRIVPEETPIALIHDAATTAVMMATPDDIEDFAIGFSLTEGVISEPGDVSALEIVRTELGVEARMWLRAPRAAAVAARRRRLAGPTGCGLCGVESLAEALRAPAQVAQGFRISAAEVHDAVEDLSAGQPLGRLTRAVHAAAWWVPGRGVVAVREDVGRHNALDKLVGALARGGEPATTGALVLTSRVSVEMVQKAAAFGAQVIIAVSAPTALAIRTAEEAGLSLIAIARHDAFEVFCGHQRVTP